MELGWHEVMKKFRGEKKLYDLIKYLFRLLN